MAHAPRGTRQHRHGGVRDERGEPRSDPGPSARHGVQRRRRVTRSTDPRAAAIRIPRGIGSFPRVLARYVRERKALTLEQAIHKMTALPASRVQLGDRGRLAPGAAADVVVFDPATVADRATFEQPFQYPEGITAVIVNGSLAFADGERKRSAAGRALRPTSSAR